MENQFRKKYFHFVRNHSASDAEAAANSGWLPPIITGCAKSWTEIRRMKLQDY